MEEALANLIPFGLAAFIVSLIWAASWAWWINSSPATDALRIKRDYEGPGKHVTGLKRCGTEYGAEFTLTYRKYLVSLRSEVTGSSTRIVGVQARFFGDPSLTEFAEPGSNTIWAILYWFLPFLADGR